jgi:hypothetical protein
MAVPDPEIGAWYEQFRGQLFRVVALDEDGGTVEVQYFDGTVEELDLEYWPELLLDSAAAPEDWSGSVDLDREDLAFDGEPLHAPLGQLNPDTLDYPDLFE